MGQKAADSGSGKSADRAGRYHRFGRRQYNLRTGPVLVGKPLQVVTNSLPVAMLFSTTDTVDLVLIGGNVHSRTGVSLGPYANQMLAKLNVQRAVLSVAGINQRGFYNSNLLLVETERAMMRAADEVIVVADSTKFGRTSLAELAELSEVDVLVTDDQIHDKWKGMLDDAGVRVIIAPPVQAG
jgi:DeoR family transcriptional regulator, fructose operon transcriptional repressor